jgi:phospholipid/cholesterol/gamma-HCH transport system ATP-binding protein
MDNHAMDTVIDVRDFHKSFSGKKVHEGVTFSVKRGECLGLIGGSGMGKSVILRSLIGLEKPDAGEIIIDGVNITRFNEKELLEIRKKVAYAFQGGALFDSMSVYENLAYPLREHTKLNEAEISKKIKDELEEFGLEGNESNFPASLSGGMQKRLGLARAIIINPSVVLYDEPTAGLDPFNTIKIQDMILRLKQKGVTSILVTHDMPSAFAVCDRIAMLMHGRIEAQGTRAELEGEGGHGVISRFIAGEEV